VSAEGDTVVTSIIVFGAAAGALLAFRQLKVFILAPASLLVAIGIIFHSRATGEDFRATIIDFIVSVSSLQIGYLVGSVADGFLMVAKPPDKVSELLRVVRTSIGQELQAVFELPRDLPPEMVPVLARLDDPGEGVGAGNNYRA
jgi:hypothetical protein